MAKLVKIIPSYILLLDGAFILVYEEVGGERFFDIHVGKTEAESIERYANCPRCTKKECTKRKRPLPYDITMAAMQLGDVTLKRLEINRKGPRGSYYSDLILSNGNTEKREDCRPSQGTALALLVGADIMLDEEFFTRKKKFLLDSEKENSILLRKHS